jgi:hypothetical protein
MDALLISDAIEGAAVMLYGVSLAYKESSNCRLEANYSHQQELDMIPMMMVKGTLVVPPAYSTLFLPGVACTNSTQSFERAFQRGLFGTFRLTEMMS